MLEMLVGMMARQPSISTGEEKAVVAPKVDEAPKQPASDGAECGGAPVTLGADGGDGLSSVGPRGDGVDLEALVLLDEAMAKQRSLFGDHMKS